MDQHHATCQISQNRALFLQSHHCVWQSNEMRFWVVGFVNDNVTPSVLHDPVDASAPEPLADAIEKRLCQICSTVEASTSPGVSAARCMEWVMHPLTLASTVSRRFDLCAIDVQPTFAAVAGHDGLTGRTSPAKAAWILKPGSHGHPGWRSEAKMEKGVEKR